MPVGDQMVKHSHRIDWVRVVLKETVEGSHHLVGGVLDVFLDECLRAGLIQRVPVASEHAHSVLIVGANC